MFRVCAAAVLILTGVVSCSRSGAQTLTIAPDPPVYHEDSNLIARAKGAHSCGERSFVSTAAAIGGRRYIGCRSDGDVLIVDAHMRRIAASPIVMYSVDRIEAAGDHAIAVSGYSDGAALTKQLSLLDSASLKPIVNDLSDESFLGVAGNRAYVDDWCCNGRADTYAPATIYSISLRDGTQSARTDLAPDPSLHPSNLAPLGQGGYNYLIAPYFYVVVSDDNFETTTYRYDLFHLDKPPLRMQTAPSVVSAIKPASPQ